MNKKILLIVFFGILLIILNLIFVLSLTKNIPNSEEEIYQACVNTKDVVSTSNCLEKQISTFYKYRITKDKIGFEDLKNNGGDCEDWSNLYYDLGKRFGYYTKLTTIQFSNEEYHMVTILSEKDNGKGKYCILDMLEVRCI